jgi:hypothetical protein
MVLSLLLVWFCVILCITGHHNTVKYSVVQYGVVQYGAVQYSHGSSVSYSIVPHSMLLIERIAIHLR